MTSAIPALAQQLDAAILDEQRRALRALLARPLIAADGPHAASFILIRRHATAIREWLARHPGWTLQIESDIARLRKTPADLSDATRPARDPKSAMIFSRRRYVLFCLALATLEQADRQITLGRLAEGIVKLVAADPALARAGLVFDLEGRDQRRDLVHVVRLLLDLRVLVRLHGDEQQYLKERGDVLYNVERPALAAMLNVRRAPSTITTEDFEERLQDLVEEPLPQTDEARNRRLRSYLTRRLLDDSLVEYDTLDADALAYLHSQRSFLLSRIQEATELEPEIRREGIALVDERGELTDLKMPEEGTDGHLTLLVAEFLAESARNDFKAGKPITAVGQAALERHIAQLVAQHHRSWRGDVKAPGAERRLANETLERLAALGLVRLDDDGVMPRPALARFALDKPRQPSPSSLFDTAPSSLFDTAENPQT